MTAVVDAADLVIRPLDGLAEREACVALQERIWGAGFADRVPASILMIAGETGGVASGAFLGGRLVGFVFGITGVRDDHPVHWSDMLAVEPEVRGRGIGYRLKAHQRELLLSRGVETVRWTFDPLEARNAHLNLRRLGAIVRDYRRDVYGRSSSPLHAGIGTDRLVAEWPIASERVARRLEGAGGPGGGATPDEPGTPGDDAGWPGAAPVLNPPIIEGDAVRPGPAVEVATAPLVRIAVPSDIQALKRAHPERAREWRGTVRTAFEAALGEGYTAVDADREAGPDGVIYYALARGFSL